MNREHRIFKCEDEKAKEFIVVKCIFGLVRSVEIGNVLRSVLLAM